MWSHQHTCIWFDLIPFISCRLTGKFVAQALERFERFEDRRGTMGFFPRFVFCIFRRGESSMHSAFHTPLAVHSSRCVSNGFMHLQYRFTCPTVPWHFFLFQDHLIKMCVVDSSTVGLHLKSSSVVGDFYLFFWLIFACNPTHALILTTQKNKRRSLMVFGSHFVRRNMYCRIFDETCNGGFYPIADVRCESVAPRGWDILLFSTSG